MYALTKQDILKDFHSFYFKPKDAIELYGKYYKYIHLFFNISALKASLRLRKAPI